MLNSTPYVADHLAPEWRRTAFVLPLVVDLAFVGALRADEIASRHKVSGGWWAGTLRFFTGAASVFLNIGHSAERGDFTGVFQHLVTPGILVLLAEAGPVYRRRLGQCLDDVELEEAAKADAARAVRDQEAERRRRREQDDADRVRRQRREDQEFTLDLEEKREAARAARELQARRLDLEEKRLTTPVPSAHNGADGMTAHRYDGTTAQSPMGPQTERPAARPAHVTDGHAPAAVPAAPVRVPVAPVVRPRLTRGLRPRSPAWEPTAAPLSRAWPTPVRQPPTAPSRPAVTSWCPWPLPRPPRPGWSRPASRRTGTRSSPSRPSAR
ncbi:hypothetical protein [Streptomyces geranii]|uniref:hypothetical protein n=1 Tax=Streptomyces geranii TaxID=2058923 RepID=UPI0013006B01|nr:hypothetical protein [Streptomyces geranii]